MFNLLQLPIFKITAFVGFLNLKYIFGGFIAVALPIALVSLVSSTISSGWLGISKGGTVRDIFSQYGLSYLNYEVNDGDEKDDWDKIGKRYMKNVADNYLVWRRSDFFNQEMSKEFCEDKMEIRTFNGNLGTSFLSKDYQKNFFCSQEPGFKADADLNESEENLQKVVSSLKNTCKKVLDMNVTSPEDFKNIDDTNGLSPWNLKVRKHDAISYCTKPELISLVAEKQGYIALDVDYGSNRDDYYWTENFKKYKKNVKDFGINDAQNFRFLAFFEEKAWSDEKSGGDVIHGVNLLKTDCLNAGATYTHDAKFMQAFEAYTKFCTRSKPSWSSF